MTFPFTTAITAGVLIVLQIALAFTVSGARGRSDVWVGDGDRDALLRAIRRHGNLAENAGAFIAGLTLLELSKVSPTLVTGLCAAFVLARLFHAAGLSRPDTRNVLRLIGGVGTYLTGIVLGGSLIWAGSSRRMRRIRRDDGNTFGSTRVEQPDEGRAAFHAIAGRA